MKMVKEIMDFIDRWNPDLDLLSSYEMDFMHRIQMMRKSYGSYAHLNDRESEMLEDIAKRISGGKDAPAARSSNESNTN